MQKHDVKSRLHCLVGNALAGARKKAGFTQREVGRLLGHASAQYVSNFERGVEAFSPTKIKTMQRLYKMNMGDVVSIILRAKKAAESVHSLE